MGAVYPELAKGADHVVRVLRQEEERFAETLENGMALLEGAIGKLKGKTFRISNMGDETEQTIRGLLEALDDTLEG